ncbi:SFT2-domain-containing protein [Coccomyxa subellipsoidea C-169]|uniref:Vesicle transport protein n=1 Tax=Coccomyxa subellipsoidea (strain C-169) TaxID=574566 RepID=I0YJK5_COCSC|nr:SFT2-domain-containing protein [Coccomyxa subellipsoidea C-169]EIE18574.1 SFT2-domain-containing protein [Coccomyxa subellipsoidea C-169]|eukprot:XP_005643118.1 SFT2-domain-containing protein [Coccomyxa subellipsoidea C-169]
MSFWKRSQDPEAVLSAVPPPESKGWWTRLKETAGLGDEPEELEMVEPTLLQQVNQATTLNRTQRIYGFLIFLGLALLFGMMASFFFLSPTRFAVLYTLSNVLMIGSTMFLMGPVKQIVKMFEKGRLLATVVYIVAMFLTLFSAIKLHNFILTLVFFIIQMLAMIWYSLSYIPFAREMAWKMFSQCFR